MVLYLGMICEMEVSHSWTRGVLDMFYVLFFTMGWWWFYMYYDTVF